MISGSPVAFVGSGTLAKSIALYVIVRDLACDRTRCGPGEEQFAEPVKASHGKAILQAMRGGPSSSGLVGPADHVNVPAPREVAVPCLAPSAGRCDVDCH